MSELHADIRKQLQQAIWPDSVHERVWRDLLTTPPHVVQLVAQGKTSVENLLRIYEHKVEIYAPSRPQKRAPRSGVSDERLEALALVAAIAAPTCVPGLDAFRELSLPSGLLAPEAIPQWVREQAVAEGAPARRAIAFPLDDDPGGRPGEILGALMMRQRQEAISALHGYLDWLEANPQAELPGAAVVPAETLAYFAPGGPLRQIAIRRDGTLGRLKQLAATLTLYLKWPEHHAVAYLLSDWTPPFPRWQLRYQEALLPALRRVVLELDPRMSAAEVASLYTESRKALGRSRDRMMGEKHLALAVFIAERVYTEKSWSELRTEWNELMLEHPYATTEDATARRFALDCRNAYARLTGQPWPGKHKDLASKWTEKAALKLLEELRAER